MDSGYPISSVCGLAKYMLQLQKACGARRPTTIHLTFRNSEMLQEVRYTETPEEAADAIWGRMDQLGVTIQFRVAWMFLAAYLGLTVAVLAFKESAPKRYVAAAAITAIVWLAIEQFQRTMTRQMMEVIHRPFLSNPSPSKECVVRLSRQGVEFALPTRGSWVAWSGIKKVTCTSRGVLFRKALQDHLIPVRVFASRDHAKAFQREAEALRQQAIPLRALAPRACGADEAMVEYEETNDLSQVSALPRHPTPPLRWLRFLALPCLLAAVILIFCRDELAWRIAWGLCVLVLGLLHMLMRRPRFPPVFSQKVLEEIQKRMAERPKIRVFLGRDRVEREWVDSRSWSPWSDYTGIESRGDWVCFLEDEEVEDSIPIKAFASQQARDRFMEVAAERIAANRPPPDA